MIRQYKKEYTEILQLLEYIPLIDFLKIPPEIISFFRTYGEKTYCFKYDISKPLNKQITSKKTYSIFLNLYYKYIVDDEKKEKIQELLKLNTEKKKKLYNMEKFFNRNNDIILNQKLSLPIETKNSFLTRLFTRIKYLFKKFS